MLFRNPVERYNFGIKKAFNYVKLLEERNTTDPEDRQILYSALGEPTSVDVHHQASKKLWKPVKSCENVTVYKDRHHDPDDNLRRGLASGINISSVLASSSGSHLSRSSSLSTEILDSIPAEEWNLSKLLMVGTLVDAIYSLATPDSGLMLLKAHCAQDEVVDGQVLAQIHSLSLQEPFRFLGLKWLVKGNPATVSALVLPRDLVLIESMGIMDHPVSGERIGYFLMHSVNLPTCPELLKKDVMRACLFSCYIFKELVSGVVDVYMKCFVELNGKVNERATLLLEGYRVLGLVAGLDMDRITEQLSAAAQATVAGDSELRDVSKSFKMYNRDSIICSRCCVTIKLAFPRPDVKAIRLKSVVVCKGCITSSSQKNTFEKARQEVLSGRFNLGNNCLGPRPSAASIATSRGTVTSNYTLTVSRDQSSSSVMLSKAQRFVQRTVPGAKEMIRHAHTQDATVSAALSASSSA